MHELFVWSEGYRGFVKKRGVPRSTECMLRDAPTTSLGNWTLYIPGYHACPPPAEYCLPGELFLEVLGDESCVQFDYLGWNHKVKIVSQRMLQFLRDQGVVEGYEIAIVKDVINRSGRVLETLHRYFALRFYLFDDHLIDFHPETRRKAVSSRDFKLYPDLVVKFGIAKQVFVLSEFVYANGLIFREGIKAAVESRGFVGPPIYPVSTFHLAYNGRELAV